MKKFFISAAACLTLLSPLTVHAQVSGVQTLPDVTILGDTTSETSTRDTVKAENIILLINKIINWVFTLLLVLAVAFIVYAGYKYLFSGGEAEAVSAAHKMLIYAAIAVAVAMLSKGIVFVVKSLVLGGNGAATTSAPTGGQSPVAGMMVSVGPLGSGISVANCPDGKTPAVSVNNVTYGNTNSIQPTAEHREAGFYATKTFGGDPSVSVQTCTDGSVPRVMIKGTSY
jgi:hypothetical protein